VRINAQLVDATTGHHLWAQRYDRPLKEIFALQDEIVQQIVTTFQLELTLRERGIVVNKTTSNPEAYDYYLRGLQYFYRYTKEANAQARQMFEKAIELDSNYALAYANVGWTYSMDLGSQWLRDPQLLDRILEWAQRAIILDDSLARAHMLMGVVYLYKKQQDRAIAEIEKCIALDPNGTFGYAWWGFILNFAGRSEGAITLAEQALRLNPRNPFFSLTVLGRAYSLTGRYEEAIVALKKDVSANPNYLPPHLNLAAVYSTLGREEEAKAEAMEILRISPDFSLASMRQQLSFADPTMVERHLAALWKAGLK
jgi:adenylate cyclase